MSHCSCNAASFDVRVLRTIPFETSCDVCGLEYNMQFPKLMKATNYLPIVTIPATAVAIVATGGIVAPLLGVSPGALLASTVIGGGIIASTCLDAEAVKINDRVAKPHERFMVGSAATLVWPLTLPSFELVYKLRKRLV